MKALEIESHEWEGEKEGSMIEEIETIILKHWLVNADVMKLILSDIEELLIEYNIPEDWEL